MDRRVESYPQERKIRNNQQCRNLGNENVSSSVFTSYGLEFCFLLYSIATSNSLIAVQNFYIDRICRVEQNISWKECLNLTSGDNQQDEKSVEVIASKFQIYQNLIEYGFPIITSFFLGSWTDKNGSKPVLVIILFGYFLSYLLYTGFSLLPDLEPQYILLSSVPIAAGGGLTALLISGLSLITRESSILQRSFRLSVLSMCFDGGATIGYLMGEKVYGIAGYTEVFAISSFLSGVSVICAAFLVSERRPENTLPGTRKHLIIEFFDIAAFKETISTCFKRRQNKRRRCILILMIALFLQFLSYSVRNYCYLFSRNKFEWDFTDYSNFSIVISLLNNIGGLFMSLIAIKLLHLADIFLGLISTLSNLSGYLIILFSTTGWYMYLGYGVQMFGAITTAVMRSILSKCVEPEDHGKLFSFVTCLEMCAPFTAGPLYGLIYMFTAMSIPSAMFLVPIGINVVIWIFYLYLYFVMDNVEMYSPLIEEERI